MDYAETLELSLAAAAGKSSETGLFALPVCRILASPPRPPLPFTSFLFPVSIISHASFKITSSWSHFVTWCMEPYRPSCRPVFLYVLLVTTRLSLGEERDSEQTCKILEALMDVSTYFWSVFRYNGLYCSISDYFHFLSSKKSFARDCNVCSSLHCRWKLFVIVLNNLKGHDLSLMHVAARGSTLYSFPSFFAWKKVQTGSSHFSPVSFVFPSKHLFVQCSPRVHTWALTDDVYSYLKGWYVFVYPVRHHISRLHQQRHLYPSIASSISLVDESVKL